MSEQRGRKDDQGKSRVDLLGPAWLIEVGHVLRFGANNYGEWNWLYVAGWRGRYTAAALRHIFKWMSGEALDPESGRSHLAHASCCLMFLFELEAKEALVPETAMDDEEGTQ